MLKYVGIVLLVSVSAVAQAPSKETLIVSLHAMSRTFASCQTAYTHVLIGHKEPIVKEILGTDNYEKDLKTLDYAERFSGELLSHPEKISGAVLVKILSTSDDFALGLQSTQTAILRAVILNKLPADAGLVMSQVRSLDDCQHRLFDDGDSFVTLVSQYVEAEDVALGKPSLTH